MHANMTAIGRRPFALSEGSRRGCQLATYDTGASHAQVSLTRRNGAQSTYRRIYSPAAPHRERAWTCACVKCRLQQPCRPELEQDVMLSYAPDTMRARTIPGEPVGSEFGDARNVLYSINIVSDLCLLNNDARTRIGTKSNRNSSQTARWITAR